MMISKAQDWMLISGQYTNHYDTEVVTHLFLTDFATGNSWLLSRYMCQPANDRDQQVIIVYVTFTQHTSGPVSESNS